MRILWFGLGRFGRPMVQNLLDRGHTVLLAGGVHAQGATREMLANGASVLESGQTVDVCGLCLPAPHDVRQVVQDLQPSTTPVVVDFSTGDPTSSRDIAADLACCAISYFDAPVSGSIAGASSGELTTWVGAANEDVPAAVRGLLEEVATNIFFMGTLGSGSAMKLVNQIVHIQNMFALGEGLRFAHAQGIDLETAVTSMKTSSADSAMLRRFGVSLATRDFDTRFALRLALKDTRLAESEAQALGLSLDAISAVGARLERLVVEGKGELDFSLVADPWSDRCTQP